MTIKDLKSKEEMLETYPMVHEMYPTLSLADYSSELDIMLTNGYGQFAVYIENECIGLSGYWVNSKLWCGKYLEADNVIISEAHRSKGVGNLLFEAIERKAIELNCTLICLDSYTENFKAHKFFYNHGYVPRGFHFINVLHSDKLR